MSDCSPAPSAILIIAAGPSAAARLNAEEHYRRIRTRLAESGLAISLAETSDLGGLAGELGACQPRILHLVAETGALLPEPDDLGAVLAPFAGVTQCVVLSGGFTARHALAVIRHLPCALLLERFQPDHPVALAFIDAFYDAIAARQSIGGAHRVASAAVEPSVGQLYRRRGTEPPDDFLESYTGGQEVGRGEEPGPADEAVSKDAFADPTPPPRYANYQLADLSGTPQPGAPLVLGCEYELSVWIGREPAGQPLADEAGQRRPIREPDNPLAATIYVVFDPDPTFFSFNENARVQTIVLPPNGAGNSSTVQLVLTPRVATNTPAALATIGVRFYYNFSEIESIRIWAEIVLEDDAGESRFGLPEPVCATYRKVGEWKRLEEIERRAVHIHVAPLPADRFELTLLYEGVQFKGALRLTKEEAEDAILEARALLEYLAVDKESPIVRGQNATTRSKVRELARLGRGLWSKLFEQERDHALWHVAAFLKQNPPAKGALIQVTVDDNLLNFVFPWNLLYDREVPPESADLQTLLDGFWGMRYCVEQVAGKLPRDGAVPLPDRLRLSFIPKQGLPNWEAQRDFITALPEISTRIEVGPVVLKKPECQDLLRDCDSHILYFYTRGFTRRRRADLVGLNAPGERSYIELSAGKLWLDEDLIPCKGEIHLKRRPIVFLNMCEGSQVTPSLSEGFVPFFLDVQAASVIGTECPMTTDYAHPFARAFFAALLAGQPVGAALLAARQAFLPPAQVEGNALEPTLAARMAVLGLAYTLYGQATLRYDPAPLPAAAVAAPPSA